jgi:peptide subunit release factor 1 (eRF1)
MTFTQELQELKSLPHTYPFVSLYVDVGHNEKSAEEMRVYARTQLRHAVAGARSARERTFLETDARHIIAYLEDVIHARVERKARGLGIFACAPHKVLHVVSSPEPFPAQLHVGDGPHLRPLESNNGNKHVLACLVDSQSARILEIGAGSIQEQAEIHNEVQRRHPHGGWSQTRFQRRVDDQIEHHHREVATALTHLSDRNPAVGVVLAGPETIVGGFREHLPERLQKRVLVDLPVSLKAHDRELVQRILDEHARTEESRFEVELEQQLEDAMSPVRGCRGVDDVLRAANEHAIRRLFVPADFNPRGWRCTSCGALGRQVPLSCSFCGGVVESSDVRDTLIAKVLASGGEVTTLPNGRSVTRGIVALLRFRP